MLSKAKLKFIKSLQLKKYRKAEQCFMVEGAKSVAELLHSDFEITLLAATSDFIDQQVRTLALKKPEIIHSTVEELASAGSLETNHSAIAVAKMRPNEPPRLSTGELALVLDDVRDPGNVGTIVRTADWYGIANVIASSETADFYNPKTISATMGSFLRVHMYYTSLAEYLVGRSNIFGAFLEGSNVHHWDSVKDGFIVIGNESNGISESVARLVHHRITIPRYGHAESLNAGVAAAVILDNFRRSNE
jgi:TrmH family RNA methyltransferase